MQGLISEQHDLDQSYRSWQILASSSSRPIYLLTECGGMYLKSFRIVEVMTCFEVLVLTSIETKRIKSARSQYVNLLSELLKHKSHHEKVQFKLSMNDHNEIALAIVNHADQIIYLYLIDSKQGTFWEVDLLLDTGCKLANKEVLPEQQTPKSHLKAPLL